LTEATLDLRQLLEDLEHVHLLDRQIKAWPELMLPRRIGELWKSRFPESPRNHSLIGQGCTTRLVEIDAAAAGSAMGSLRRRH
jgi:hypothetical protein